MAKKFSIQPAPTFKADVSIPRVGGETMVVPFTFRYLDRLELAGVFDQWRKQQEELIETESESVQESTQRETDMQVEQIKQIVTGWAFDDEFNDENIRALVLTSVAAPSAVLKAYHQAYLPAKSGN